MRVIPGPLSDAPKREPSHAQRPNGETQLASSGLAQVLALLGCSIEQGR